MVEISSDDCVWQLVELIEDYGDLKKGLQGVCTADLPDNDIFAVMSNEYGWITFEGGARSKFKIISMEDFDND